MNDKRVKWNNKYNNIVMEGEPAVPNAQLSSVQSYFNGGRALDIACGLGANSLFLAQEGYVVTAYDLSDTAIHHLQDHASKMNLPIVAKVTDLTREHHLYFPSNSFDFVIMVNYLDRELFPHIKNCMKKDGFFFMETYFKSNQSSNEHINDRYKLNSQELLHEFKDWRILMYLEDKHSTKQTLFCQKTM